MMPLHTVTVSSAICTMESDMADNETKGVQSQVNHRSFNLHIGEMLTNSVQEFVEEYLDKKDDVELGPLDLLGKLEDDDFDFSQLPIVGSTKGNNPHKFKYTNDRNREVTGDAFKFIYMGTVKGKEYLAKLEDAELALSKSNSHQSKIYADKVGNVLFLEDEQRMLKARITAGGNVWMKTAAIQQMMAGFETRVDKKKCVARYNTYTDAKGNEHIHRTKAVFVIGDPTKVGNATSLTINEFISLDLDLGLANGGTYAAILATLQKGADDTRTVKFKINSVEDVFAMLANIGVYLDPVEEIGRTRQQQMQKLMAKEGGDAYLLSFGAGVTALDPMWPEVEKDYNRLSAEARKAMRDKRDAEKEAKGKAA